MRAYIKTESIKKVVYTAAAAAMIFAFAACCKHNKPAADNYAAIDAAHNSQNSLDWDGTYRGIVPCADCEGIQVEITLTQKGTYTLKYAYLGKSKHSYKETGKFKWNSTGSNIVLDTKDYPSHYKVGENVLFQLDMEGKKITGKLADNYRLQKID